MRRAATALSAVVAWGCSPSLPPFPETLVVVDTDLSVPRTVRRLRIDSYDSRGRWFDSRDIALPDSRDWPVSFSVWSQDEEQASEVWLRLRLYPDGRVRDYLGERFWDWTMPIEDGFATWEPRLVKEGTDLTPPSEPQPLVTVDRLVRVPIDLEERGRVRVVLHAACAGTMPWLSDTGLPLAGQAYSCVAEEKQRELVDVLEVDRGNLERPTESLQGSLEADCGEPTDPARVCIPGGPTILGSAELGFVPDLEPLPERMVIHSPFWVDRQEISVGRFRTALASGFLPSEMPTANPQPLGMAPDNSTCSWSTNDIGREGYALSCISWQLARELCQWAGGDLPTEAQWEHMATLAAPNGRSRYPWGDEAPSCTRASYGRLPLAGTAGQCQLDGIGPEPIEEGSANDLTLQEVQGLAGGLSEWQLDAYESYRSACWGASPVHEPLCWQEQPAMRSIRGGSWPSPPTILASAVREGADPAGRASFIGARCVYSVESQP